MEGNRHEKVAIVLSAYIIGFTTAFIGFGINDVYEVAPTEMVVVESSKLNQIDKALTEEDVITSVSLGDDGLYASTKENTFLLSAKKTSFGASLVATQETPGQHYAVEGAEVSRDGKFAYFCEQLSENNDTCDAYVYSLKENTLYKVSYDGVAYAPAIASHVSSWSEEGLLHVNKGVSISKNEPWRLVSKNSEEIPNIKLEDNRIDSTSTKSMDLPQLQ